jgi:hypothetical protein
MGPSGAAYPDPAAAARRSGAGKALRSTLPLALIGSASSGTNTDGIMYSGNVSAKNSRNTPAAGAASAATR